MKCKEVGRKGGKGWNQNHITRKSGERGLNQGKDTQANTNGKRGQRWREG